MFKKLFFVFLLSFLSTACAAEKVTLQVPKTVADQDVVVVYNTNRDQHSVSTQLKDGKVGVKLNKGVYTIYVETSGVHYFLSHVTVDNENTVIVFGDDDYI